MPTAKAVFEGSVQGVVVQAKKKKGKRDFRSSDKSSSIHLN